MSDTSHNVLYLHRKPALVIPWLLLSAISVDRRARVCCKVRTVQLELNIWPQRLYYSFLMLPSRIELTRTLLGLESSHGPLQHV